MNKLEQLEKLMEEERRVVVKINLLKQNDAVKAYLENKKRLEELKEKKLSINMALEREKMMTCDHVFAIHGITEGYEGIKQCLKCSLDNESYLYRDYPGTSKDFSKRDWMMVEVWKKALKDGRITEEVYSNIYKTPEVLKSAYNLITQKNPNASLEEIKEEMPKKVELVQTKEGMQKCNHRFVIYGETKYGSVGYKRCMECSLDNFLSAYHVDNPNLDLSKYDEMAHMMKSIWFDESRRGNILLVKYGDPNEIQAVYRKIIDPTMSFDEARTKMENYFKSPDVKTLEKRIE